MQALASLGFLRLLLVGFGRRWGIVPPLVLYLATAFTVAELGVVGHGQSRRYPSRSPSSGP